MSEIEAKTRLKQLVPPEVLADEAKLKILKLLSIKETCEYEIMSKLAQKDVPQHLKVLEKEGIVKKRPEGLRMMYSLSNPEIGKFLANF
ncbi:MAG: helix-turn-helix transcriptional regulator [archaeon]|nr:helix-turn-helix transcriptional regulator [archaeon]MCP8319786.1 helix-turn-helix transcriptional regulator [archaeon]